MTFPEGPSAEATPTSGPIRGLTTAPIPAPIMGVVTPFPQRSTPTTTASAHQTVAWRAPGITRFDGRPANDFLTRAEAVVPFRTYGAKVAQPAASPPAGWFTFAVGACIAALMGALVGGVMSV